MDEDKIIADYIRQYYPEVLNTIHFQAFQAGKIMGNAMIKVIEPLRIVCSKLNAEAKETIMKGRTDDEQ